MQETARMTLDRATAARLADAAEHLADFYHRRAVAAFARGDRWGQGMLDDAAEDLRRDAARLSAIADRLY